MRKPAASSSTNTKPALPHVVEALSYREILVTLKDFFHDARMPTVGTHLEKACAEIDRIWEKDEFTQHK